MPDSDNLDSASVPLLPASAIDDFVKQNSVR